MTNTLITEAVRVANGSRASIGITEKHVTKMLACLAAGADIAWLFGAKSMSSRAAFVIAVKDGDVVRLAYADVTRQDANKGPAGAFPGFPSGPLGAPIDVKGETPEKKAAARAAGRGIETNAGTLAPGMVAPVTAWARHASQGALSVDVVRTLAA